MPLRTATLPANRSPLWFGSNHDHSRLATRWAEGDERKARAALFLLLTLRGSAILYQGDELALTDGVVSADRITDVAGPTEPPARIHGDLWSGNLLWALDGRVWLVDAASAHGGQK